MSEDEKAGVPRWILIATALVGLVAAILVAAAKYYEMHKARVETARLQAEEPPPPLGDKGLTKTASSSFIAGSVWECFTDERMGIKTKIEIDQCENGRFKGIMIARIAEVDWVSTRIQGTINPEKDVEFTTRIEDQLSGKEKLTPCRFKCLVRDDQLIGRWQAVNSGANYSFTLTRK